jgi:hypothetical protein
VLGKEANAVTVAGIRTTIEQAVEAGETSVSLDTFQAASQEIMYLMEQDNFERTCFDTVRC